MIIEKHRHDGVFIAKVRTPLPFQAGKAALTLRCRARSTSS